MTGVLVRCCSVRVYSHLFLKILGCMWSLLAIHHAAFSHLAQPRAHPLHYSVGRVSRNGQQLPIYLGYPCFGSLQTDYILAAFLSESRARTLRATEGSSSTNAQRAYDVVALEWLREVDKAKQLLSIM